MNGAIPLAHEWEQLDQGEAYCLHCGIDSARADLPCVRSNMKRPLRELMDEFLLKVYGGTAHEHRKQVLEEFVAWVEGYEVFVAECDKIVDEAFESAGLQRVR